MHTAHKIQRDICVYRWRQPWKKPAWLRDVECDARECAFFLFLLLSRFKNKWAMDDWCYGEKEIATLLYAIHSISRQRIRNYEFHKFHSNISSVSRLFSVKSYISFYIQTHKLLIYFHIIHRSLFGREKRVYMFGCLWFINTTPYGWLWSRSRFSACFVSHISKELMKCALYCLFRYFGGDEFFSARQNTDTTLVSGVT